MSKLNRRGHMPTVMLFVAGIVIYIAMLFAFVSFKGGYVDLPGQATYVSGALDFDELYAEKLIERALFGIKGELASTFNEESFKKSLAFEVSSANFVFYQGGQGVIDKMKSGDFKVNKNANGNLEISFENVILREVREGLTGVRLMDFVAEVNVKDDGKGNLDIQTNVRKVYKGV